MLLALLILPILVSATPFHKYPYVFVLDVGNEELEKVNTEQIRLSSPGGSVALRYPAIGNGDDIAHVRVSGIDFGTDLKANIVDGGPGYKYVEIVLMGNSGVEYDAVITIQTVPVVNDSAQIIEDNSIENLDEGISYQVSEDDPNDSAEDLKDCEEDLNQIGINSKSAELTQESSNVYSYSQNEALSGYGSQHDGESENNRDDDDSETDNSIDKLNENYDRKDNIEVEDYDPNEDDPKLLNQPVAEKLREDDYRRSDNQPIIDDESENNKDDDYSNRGDSIGKLNENFDRKENVEVEDYDPNENDPKLLNQPVAEMLRVDDYRRSDNQPIIVDQNLYNKYIALRDHLYNGSEVYSQDGIQSNPAYGVNQNYDDVIEQVYDYYEETNQEKYRDVNNNFIDADEASAVEQ